MIHFRVVCPALPAVPMATVPALANVPVALVNGRPGEAGGAAVQLVLDVAILCVVGALALGVERRWLDGVHVAPADDSHDQPA